MCPRPLVWLHRALIAVLAVYFASTIPGVRPHPGYNAVIDNGLQNGILVAAALIILLRVIFVSGGRLGWGLISAGLALFALGSILYFSYVQFQTVPPTPALSDYPWLASYPFLFAGLVTLVRQQVGGADRTVWLDGLLATLGVTAIGSIWLYFIFAADRSGWVSVAVTMAYPGGDLVLLLVVIAGWSLLGGRPGRGVSYLGLGLLIFAAADTIYTIRIAEGAYQGGTMLDPMWAVGVVLIAAAALRETGAPAIARQDGWAPLVLPLLFTGTSIAILVADRFLELPVLTTCLATADLAIGLVRAAVSFREVQRLAVSRQEARTDELTGLGNRRHFTEVVSERIAVRDADERHGVLLIDLDLFKEVNDTHGHAVGDAVLVQVGERLAACLRGGDTLVRLGGDEFAVMLIDVTVEVALDVAERIRTELRRPLTAQHVMVQLDASIGIAMWPEAALTVQGLLHGADSAMYEAKTHRLGCFVHGATDNDHLARRQLVAELRTAIVQGGLVLHYQPKFELGGTTICGVEALVRWNHPTRGLLFPDAFIALAERFGLMRELTSCVLGLALDQATRWLDAGLRVPVAVNVSAANLSDSDLPQQVADMLAVRGLDGTALVVEVTETMLMNDAERAVSGLRALRTQGVRISIDDYGTGYSSLSRLRDLPINEIKLDRSFIAELDTDERTAAIVDSTIRLAHSLGMTVVAEGIETAEALAMLTAMGCDVGQGYHLGRPVPAERLLLTV